MDFSVATDKHGVRVVKHVWEAKIINLNDNSLFVACLSQIPLKGTSED